MQPTKKDRSKWSVQKNATKQRLDKNGNSIEFRLSFDEWFAWWLQTGHYHERGCKKGQYVMARTNDIGHYEIGNIYCCLHTENSSSANKGHVRNSGKTRSQETKDKIGSSNRGKVRSQATCPHCGKRGGVNAMAKWHFDGCKYKNQIVGLS